MLICFVSALERELPDELELPNVIHCVRNAVGDAETGLVDLGERVVRRCGGEAAKLVVSRDESGFLDIDHVVEEIEALRIEFECPRLAKTKLPADMQIHVLHRRQDVKSARKERESIRSALAGD